MFNSDNSKINFVLFSAPFLLMYSLFFLIPMIMGVWYSFTDWNGMSGNYQIVGLSNYIRCFQDARFLQSFIFTFKYTGLYTVTANILALILAVCTSRNNRNNTALRAVFFTPNVLNLATVGFIWQFILGTLNTGLYKMTGWPVFEISWLNNKDIVLYTVTIVRVWVSVGYLMVIYIAGIQGIDSAVREAAIVDGADGFKLFSNITFPLIMPAVTSCIFISLVTSLKIFPLLLTLTNGGPGHYSESVSLNAYREAFENYRFGYASAKAMLFTVVILVITGIQLVVSKRRESDIA